MRKQVESIKKYIFYVEGGMIQRWKKWLLITGGPASKFFGRQCPMAAGAVPLTYE